MIGLFASQQTERGYDEAWMKSVCSAVADSRVRYMFGVFWRGKEENEKLFKYLNVREGGLFFQPFWTEDADDRFGDEDMAAVAERFGVVEQNARYIVVYPAYAMVRGPCQQVSVPAMRHQPWWLGLLSPCKSGIEKNLGHLSDLPQLQQEEIEVDLEDSLPMKQKIAPTNLWRTGVHQMLLWVGHSRPSKSSNTLSNARRRQQFGHDDSPQAASS